MATDPPPEKSTPTGHTPPSDRNLENGHPKTRQRHGFFSRERILGPVDPKHGDLALLACCFVTGLVDAAVFSNWECFVGMQTGNTVILGLSTAGLPSNPHGWLTTLISILSFLLGAFTTFRLSARLVPAGPSTNRLWNGSLFLLQGLFILLSAALAQTPGLIPQNPAPSTPHDGESPGVIENIRIVALLPLLGFQSGMQIASSRLLGYNELPVNVLTSTYCDIMGDFRLLATNNVKRNRRVAAVGLLAAGAVCSGWLLRSRGGLPSVLWISAGVKIFCGVGVWAVVPAGVVEG